MPAQVNIFLLLSGILQGIFLAVVLLHKKVHKAGYTLLVCYLVVMVLQVTLKVMSKIWLWENLRPLYSLSYFFPLLYGPLLYLFTQRIFLGKKLNAYDCLHFLPFATAIFAVAGNYYPLPSLLTGMFYSSFVTLLFELASIFAYHLLAYRNWKHYRQKIKNNDSGMSMSRTGWIRQFIVVSFITCLLTAVAIYCLYAWYPFYQEIRFGFVALAVFIYWISYSAWIHPQLFLMTENNTVQTKEIRIAPPLRLYRAPKKYSNSGLSTAEEQRIMTMLDRLVEQEKLFLQSELTIDDLAERIVCSRHHLSQVLNARMQKSFYDYINFYRVEEAKSLLASAAAVNHKIASIAYDAGFNSLSTFNEVFKKCTGLTPSQYRKQPAELPRKQRV